MQLENYISDLLYRYNCVVIPNFGAFLTNKVSAKVHETTHSFYPPKKMLSFNEQLQANDGLLANYIAEIEKIPYETAVDTISNQVKSMKSYLTEGETIALENIGELLLNTEGRMVFNPSYHINYLTDAFGLSHFTIDTVVKREVYKETVIKLEAIAPVVLTPEKRSKTNWLRYAAVTVGLIGLSGFVGANYYTDQIETQNQIAAQDANAQLEAKVQEATFIMSNPLPAVFLSIEKVQTGNYHLVAGAFRVEANANRKVRQLIAEGFNGAKKAGKNANGLYIVIYGSYPNRSQAFRELKLIQRDYNPDAWVYIKILD